MTASSTHQPGPPITAAITVSAPSTTSAASAKNLSTDPTSWDDDATDRAPPGTSLFSRPAPTPPLPRKRRGQTGRPPDAMSVTLVGAAYTMTAMTSMAAAGPRGLLMLEPVPHGHTASRLDWLLLPPMVRHLRRGPVRHHRRGGDLGRLGLHPRPGERAGRGERPPDLPQGREQEGAAAVRGGLCRGGPQAAQPPLRAPDPAAALVARGRPVGAAGAGVRRGGEPQPALDRPGSSRRAWTRCRSSRRR